MRQWHCSPIAGSSGQSSAAALTILVCRAAALLVRAGGVLGATCWPTRPNAGRGMSAKFTTRRPYAEKPWLSRS
jgi:hypothetical protein